VDANAASSAANRFNIVFARSITLPVTFTNVKAFKVNNTIQVDWEVQDETNIVKYEVEKSANGQTFILANTVVSKSVRSYSWIDESPFEGENFFRIKTISRSGAIKYSQVVNVLMDRRIIPFTILANPISGTTIHLYFANQPVGNYSFNLINDMGQLVSSDKHFINAGATAQSLKMNGELPAGVYQLQITGPANKTETLTLIKQH
jgi:hypothetical protein